MAKVVITVTDLDDGAVAVEWDATPEIDESFVPEEMTTAQLVAMMLLKHVQEWLSEDNETDNRST